MVNLIQDKVENIDTSPKKIQISNRILSILQPDLHLTNSELNEIEKNSTSTRDTITALLKKKNLLSDPKIAIKLFWIDAFEYYSLFNKSVFNNKDVLLAWIKNDIDIYKISTFALPINNLLHKDFSEHKLLADLILKKHVKKSTKFEDVEVFIKQIAWDNSECEKTLMKMYESHLKIAHKLNSNDIKSKALILASNKDLYNIFSLFKNSKILNKTLELDKKIAKDWSIEIWKLVADNNFENTKENVSEFLMKKIWIKSDNLKNPDVLSLIHAIYSVLQINIVSQDSSIDIDSDSNKFTKDIEWDSWSNLDDTNNEKFDYCNDDSNCNCVYNYTSWWSYIIDTQSSKITISKNEYEQFSPNSLENYIKLHDLLSECGLKFLLHSKYKSEFFLFMQSKHTWFSPMWWSGFTKILRLDVLNVLANMIWIPENLYWEGSNIWKFPDINTAVEALKSIYSSWDINGEKVAKAWWWLMDNAAAEVRLQDINVLWENWGFSLSKAHEILKKWWYTSKDSVEKSDDISIQDSMSVNEVSDNVTSIFKNTGNNKDQSDAIIDKRKLKN